MSLTRQAVAVSLMLVYLAGCDGEAPAKPEAPSPLTEITAEVGLARDTSWPDGSYFLPEIMGPGIALVDYDDDGDLDLYQVRMPPPARREDPAPNRLFRQEPDGTFVDVSARSGADDAGFGQGVAVGDVDNDGDRDLYVANYGTDALYRNDGDGTFTRAASFGDGLWSSSATFCDYDRDGDLDLYVANYVKLDYPDPCRTNSGAPDYCGPQTYDGEPDRLYRNEGGRFVDVTTEAGIRLADPTEAKGLGVVCLDLTGDGWVDFYVANDGVANQLWVNRGDGTFADEALIRGVAFNRHGKAEASMGVAVGDVDGDGTIDLFMTHLTQENNTLYLGGRGPLFMDRTVEFGLPEHDLLLTGFGCGLFDLDHDGDLDLAVANGGVRRGPTQLELPDRFWDAYTEPNLLLENVGRSFDSIGSDFGTRREVSRGLAFGDLDTDGDLDLVLSNVDDTVRVFRNDAPPEGSHWLLVRALEGLRDAVGARITLQVGAGTRVGFVQPGYSYQSSSDPRVHFGLGSATRVDGIDVLWPDGSRERFDVPAVDREVVVRKGGGSS